MLNIRHGKCTGNCCHEPFPVISAVYRMKQIRNRLEITLIRESRSGQQKNVPIQFIPFCLMPFFVRLHGSLLIYVYLHSRLICYNPLSTLPPYVALCSYSCIWICYCLISVWFIWYSYKVQPVQVRVISVAIFMISILAN